MIREFKHDEIAVIKIVEMAVKQYCSQCMKKGEFVLLKFVMLNIESGLWVCPKEEVRWFKKFNQSLFVSCFMILLEHLGYLLLL